MSGVLFVMTYGGYLMLMWPAGSWDLLQQVLNMCFVINSALWFTLKWLETLERFSRSHIHIIGFSRSHIHFSRSHIHIIISQDHTYISQDHTYILFVSQNHTYILYSLCRCCTNQVCLLWPGNWSYSPRWCPMSWNWDTTDWLSC